MPRPAFDRLATLVAAAALACAPPVEVASGGPVAGWPEYGATPGGTRHSLLTQITPDNVRALEVAWTYRHGDVEDGSQGPGVRSSFQATPILVDDALVFCTPFDRVIALDAATGEERWSYDPEVARDGMYLLNCRGVASWLDVRTAPGAACRRRVFLGTLDARLIALDASSGQPCEGFGDGGTVDLREGIGDVQPGEYGMTSPPAVIGDRVITGAMVLDNRRVDAPSGVVRAWDARSGRRLWAWDPVPPGAASGDPDGSGYRRGTANAWTPFAVDGDLGLVYAPTGNTSPDYYGGQRDGLDFYASSLVALDAKTGLVRWHFRTVHHDLWDYDVSSQPVFVDVERDGAARPGLVQATKMGHLFFLDRRSGEPLFPVEERAVPQAGAVPGETLSPTQPFPLLPEPIHPPTLTPEDAFGFTFWDRGRCRERIAAARSDGIFTPPSLEGTIQYPGMAGGANWGSGSVDAERGIFVINTSRMATYVRLVPRDEFDERFPDGPPAFGFEPQLGTPYALERHLLLSPFGAPCNPPPWGTLVAIDVASGERRWEVPLGTARDMAPFPIWLLAPDGVPGVGGPITTASGLTFIGAATDRYLRAFRTETGEELWRGRLPHGAQATPMTYRLSRDSRQLVVVAAGGHGLIPGSPGDALVAFALP